MEYDCPAHDLRFGLRAFYDQIDDYQFNQGSPFTTDFVILNASEVTASGVEFDAAWAPVDGLTIRGSAGYTDVEFDSFRDPYTNTSFNGNTVPFVPEYTGSIGIRYQFPCGFYAQAAARLVGRTHYDAANTPGFTQGSYVTCDAEIGYLTEHFSVALYGTNLFDESYYSFINPQIRAGSPGDPRMFGVRVRAAF